MPLPRHMKSQRQHMETSKGNTLQGRSKSFCAKYLVRSYKIDHCSDFSIHHFSSSSQGPPTKVTTDRASSKTTASAARIMDGPPLLSPSAWISETCLRKDPVDNSSLETNEETRLLLSLVSLTTTIVAASRSANTVGAALWNSTNLLLCFHSTPNLFRPSPSLCPRPRRRSSLLT